MQNIDSDLIRGNIDTIILKTMLNEDKYGLDIIKEVEQRSSGTYELKQPTLYSCLKRLENQELISSYWVNSDIGGKRHYYKLTDKGRDFYNKKQEEWAKSKFVIDNLLSSYNYEEYRLVKKDDYDKVMNQEINDDSPSEVADADDNLDNLEDYFNESNTSDDEQIEATIENEQNFNNSTALSEEDETSNSLEDDFSLDESDQEDESDINTIENNFDEDDFDENEEYSNEEPEVEDEEIVDNGETDDQMVYVNQTDNQEETDENEENSAAYNLPDQTQNETNILNMLHKQKNEEINTYEGDKKSYANQIKSIYDDVKYVQDDMTFVGHDEDEHDEVDQKLKDWTDAANNLNEFENSLRQNSDNETEENNEIDDEELENQNNIDEELDNNEELDFAEYDNDSSISSDENLLDNNFEENDDLDEDFTINEDEEFSSQDDEGGIELQDEPENNEQNSSEEDYGYSEFDFNADEDEEIDNSCEDFEFENTLSQDNQETNDSKYQADTSFFASSNESYSSDNLLENENNASEIEENNYAENYNYSPNPLDTNDFQPDQFASYQNNKFNQDEYDRTFINVHKDTENYTDNLNENIETDDIDSIIAKNVTSKSRNSENNFYERRYIDENYKQKLSNLTVYSRASTDKSIEEKTQKNENTQADDIETLKTNFEREGIKVKEHKKLSNSDEVEKNYLLINKINLIKSLILFFCFAFTLSGMYLILNNTSFAFISEDFKFTSFLIGMIPFAILVLYHLIIYIISPYKKVPARFASRIMIFLSVIVTVQLLLITYCVNLQLGFYSFTQAGYNHLLWVIPTTISFGPIISNIIYAALFYSENFNV